MRRAWHIATKELLQTRRDRLAALFTLVLPVIFTIVLGILIGGAEEASRPSPAGHRQRWIGAGRPAAGRASWRRRPSSSSRP